MNNPSPTTMKECKCECHCEDFSQESCVNHIHKCQHCQPSEPKKEKRECECCCHHNNPDSRTCVLFCSHCKPSEEIHKIGSHGAVVFVGKDKDICVECKKPVESEEKECICTNEMGTMLRGDCPLYEEHMKIDVEPSEEKEELEHLVKHYEYAKKHHFSEGKECKCDPVVSITTRKKTAVILSSDCPIHGEEKEQGGWEEELEQFTKDTYSYNMHDISRGLQKKKLKSFITNLLKEEREKTKQLLLERIPEKKKIQGKDINSDIKSVGFNQALDDITQVIESVFEGKEEI